MFALPRPLRKMLRPVVLLVAALTLAACEAGMIPDNAGPRVGGGDPVRVALLIPQSDAGAAPVAAALENATRMAIAEFGEDRVALRVYDTAGQAETAAARARQAVDDGAQVILGPLFGEAANAAGIAVADRGVPVLSFSNTPGIAGGNVLILGQTFQNTATRLMQYAATQRQENLVVVHPQDSTGQIARIAVEQAAARSGIRVMAAEAYPLSVEGVSATAQRIRASTSAGADTVFITTDATNAAMPMLLQMMPENGVSPAQVQYIGLTRWDVRPDLFALPGAEGAWFALPDRSRQSAFEARYTQAFGTAPHPLAGLGYDGIAAILAVAGSGSGARLSTQALTGGSRFDGATGPFRFLPDGTTQRALAIATVRNRQVMILDPAPIGLAGPAS